MLKNCFQPTNYNISSNKTCGEIVCQSETSFTIVCKFCDIKIFEYDEFVEHFRTKHYWSEISKASNNLEKVEVNCDVYDEAETEINIKTEEKTWDEGEDILVVEFNLSEEDEKDGDWHEDDGKCENSNSSNDDEEDLEPLAILKKKTKLLGVKKEKPFKCCECNSSFTNKSTYENHLAKHEGSEFKCNQCDKKFIKEIQLTKHMRSHNGYKCKDCGKIFQKYETLRYHSETHIQTRNFVCDFKNCSKAFANQRRLNSHKRLHFVEPSFVCEVCGCRQRNNKALADHIRTHTGEKPFACQSCDRSFSSKSLLLEHQACHETERKHICNVCGKSFNRKKALYHHKHLHLDVKKFVCKICGSAYSQAAGLSAHLRKHKEDKFTNDVSYSSTSNNLLNVLFPF